MQSPESDALEKFADPNTPPATDAGVDRLLAKRPDILSVAEPEDQSAILGALHHVHSKVGDMLAVDVPVPKENSKEHFDALLRTLKAHDVHPGLDAKADEVDADLAAVNHKAAQLVAADGSAPPMGPGQFAKMFNAGGVEPGTPG